MKKSNPFLIMHQEIDNVTFKIKMQHLCYHVKYLVANIDLSKQI